jgi:hypothetical protein
VLPRPETTTPRPETTTPRPETTTPRPETATPRPDAVRPEPDRARQRDTTPLPTERTLDQPPRRNQPGERRSPLESDRPASPFPVDPERTRIPLPGAERQPDRIPGGTPGIGPSQFPTGPGTQRTLPVPDLNDRRIPSTAPGIPGTGPGARRPELSPQFPQSGTSPRQPQTSAERQPLRQPQSTGNRLTIPRVPQAQPVQPRPEPRISRRPEPARSPQPMPRVESPRPSTPAVPQTRSSPPGGSRGPEARAPGRGAGAAPGRNEGKGGRDDNKK